MSYEKKHQTIISNDGKYAVDLIESLSEQLVLRSTEDERVVSKFELTDEELKYLIRSVSDMKNGITKLKILRGVENNTPEKEIRFEAESNKPKSGVEIISRGADNWGNLEVVSIPESPSNPTAVPIKTKKKDFGTKNKIVYTIIILLLIAGMIVTNLDWLKGVFM